VNFDVLEAPIAAAYQGRSYPDDADQVLTWLGENSELSKAQDAETLLMLLCSRISKTIVYQRRMAKGVQTPIQTLQLGTGSCRDMATLMMEAARALGFPARFASGYLDCPASEAGRAAMHAWTEVYLPVLGWRGFDPTICEPASLKHIVVGVSHHPRGVMPVSGQFIGPAADFVDMNAAVKIEKIDDHPVARA
jgi:transglutaminase-like putative cysteine protease